MYYQLEKIVTPSKILESYDANTQFPEWDPQDLSRHLTHLLGMWDCHLERKPEVAKDFRMLNDFELPDTFRSLEVPTYLLLSRSSVLSLKLEAGFSGVFCFLLLQGNG